MRKIFLFFLILWNFSALAQTQNCCDKAESIALFEAYPPSYEDQTEQGIPYKVYAFRDKEWFQPEKWYLVLVSQKDIGFFIKTRHQEISYNFLLNNALCLITKNNAIQLKNQRLNLYDLDIKAYYKPKRKALRLLRRSQKHQSILQNLKSDSLQKIQLQWQDQLKNFQNIPQKIKNIALNLDKIDKNNPQNSLNMLLKELTGMEADLQKLQEKTKSLPFSFEQNQVLKNITASQQKIQKYIDSLQKLQKTDKKTIDWKQFLKNF